MVHIRLRNTFLGILITSLVVSGVLAIVIFLFARFDAMELKVLFSTLDVGACSLAGLCCATLFRQIRWFSILGIIISALCMCMLLYTIWTYDRLADYNVLLSLVVLTGTFAHLSLVLLTKTPTPASKYVLWITLFFISGVAALLLLIIWRDSVAEFFYRLLGVFGILDVIGTIVSPVVGRKRRLEDVME